MSRRALAGRYIGRGMDQRAFAETLRGLMLARPEEPRTSAGTTAISRSAPLSPRRRELVRRPIAAALSPG